MMTQDMSSSGGSTMPHKYLFKPRRHASFFGCVLTIYHIEINCQTFKACQTKSICVGTMKLGQTHTNKQTKLQVAAFFRDNAI